MSLFDFTDEQIKNAKYDEKKDLSHSKYSKKTFRLGDFLRSLADHNLNFFFTVEADEELLDWMLSTGISIYANEMDIDVYEMGLDNPSTDFKNQIIEHLGSALIMEYAFRLKHEEVNPHSMKLMKLIKDGWNERRKNAKTAENLPT